MLTRLVIISLKCKHLTLGDMVGLSLSGKKKRGSRFGVFFPDSHEPVLKHNTPKGLCDSLACSPDLVQCDSSLDPGRHCIHTGAHPQEVQGLMLLTDGVLCMDPGCLHVALMDGLRDTRNRSIYIYIIQSVVILQFRLAMAPGLW